MELWTYAFLAIRVMKKLTLFGYGVCLLILAGCSSTRETKSQLVTYSQPSPTTPSKIAKAETAVDSANSPASSPLLTNSTTTLPATTPITAAQQESQTTTAIAQSGINRKADYDFSTPIPQIGRTTIRRSLAEFDRTQMVAPCPPDTVLLTAAESTNYHIQICSAEDDPTQPAYYMGFAKDGSGDIVIPASDRQAARQNVFRNGNYTYSIYADGRAPERMNAYLEVLLPNGEMHAEALWYLYRHNERGSRPTEPSTVSEVLRPALETLKQQTSLPILLPSTLSPVEQDGQTIYAQGSGDANTYSVSLTTRPTCGANACTVGSLTATVGEQPYEPVYNQPVMLSQGITGYFKPLSCGGSCSPPALQWMYEGVLYEIQLELPRTEQDEQARNTLATIASSAIEAGPR